MTKNHRFSWKNAREEEAGFHFEHAESSHRSNEYVNDTTPQQQSDLRNDGGIVGMQYNSARNEITDNRMLVNDELYIAPGEHPGMVLTSDSFDGKNFHSWCRAVRRGLWSRNKLGFIDGSNPEPKPESIDHKQWIKVDYLVFNWLSNSVIKEISRPLQNLETSKQLWDELHKRFGKRNGPRIYKVTREIATYTQHTQSVLLYFNNLSSLWDDLALLKSSRSCTCEAAEDSKSDLEEEQMMQFLMGLNDCYEPIRQQILILSPLPTVSQAYGMVLQVEEQMNVSSQYSEGVEQSAMYNNQGRGFKGNGFKKKLSKEEKAKLKCDHCQRTGHTKTDCFDLIGIPEWYQKFKTDKTKSRAHFVNEQGDNGVGGTESLSDMSKMI